MPVQGRGFGERVGDLEAHPLAAATDGLVALAPRAEEILGRVGAALQHRPRIPADADWGITGKLRVADAWTLLGGQLLFR